MIFITTDCERVHFKENLLINCPELPPTFAPTIRIKVAKSETSAPLNKNKTKQVLRPTPS